MTVTTISAAVTTKSDIGPKKILVLLPVASRSHHHIFSPVINALLERGHHVTVVSSLEQKEKHPHLREIPVRNPLETFMANMTVIFFSGHKNLVEKTLVGYKIAPWFTEVIFESPKALALMKEKFDLVIGEPLIYEEPLLGFAYYFGCPSVNLHPLGYSHSLNEFTGGAINPAYVPNLFGTAVKPETFLERLENTLTSVFMMLSYHLYYLPKADAQMRTVFPDAPPLSELLKNISLTLITSNSAIMHPVPLAPSVIEVGGIHIKPGKGLPADLRKWIEDSEHGIVYFSLGTNLRANLMPQEKRDAILRSFGKLKQRVLIKWNGEVPAHPPNCRFEEWVPQQEVLAHPNLKVFMTHGGLLSTQESVYFGAAIIGMPVFGDQFMNMETATKQGYAVQVSVDDLNTDTLDAALNETINNPKYRETAKELSLRFRLDPIPPIEKAVYYLEQLMKLGSFKHLQPSSVHLHWYQYMLLDVIGVILIALYMTYRIISYICSTLISCCSKSSKAKSD